MSAIAILRQLPHFPELILSQKRENTNYCHQKWNGDKDPNARVAQNMAEQGNAVDATNKKEQSNYRHHGVKLGIVFLKD
jgi:hypothetical protein